MRVWVDPPAIREIADLPGNVRQRIRRAIAGLGENPHPAGSKQLTVSGVPFEVWRLRLEHWRLIYTVDPGEELVIVLGVRRRPPYDYDDLADLLSAVP